MKPGNISQYAHLSQFKSVQQFNESIKHFIKKHGDDFTKGELHAFHILTRFSVKQIGICNARICKLVEVAQTDKCGLSRSTFERMLRKAKQKGIITIHHTTREKGGFSHNVYVFHHFDVPVEEKLMERDVREKHTPQADYTTKKAPETKKPKNKYIIKENHRSYTLQDLDHTFVPSYVPETFTKAAKPFFNRAVEICNLWDRATIAYNQLKFDDPIEDYTTTIIKAFKETVYNYKRGRIKKDFIPYFYGTCYRMLVSEKRRIYRTENAWRWKWLEG